MAAGGLDEKISPSPVLKSPPPSRYAAMISSRVDFVNVMLRPPKAPPMAPNERFAAARSVSDLSRDHSWPHLRMQYDGGRAPFDLNPCHRFMDERVSCAAAAIQRRLPITYV